MPQNPDKTPRRDARPYNRRHGTTPDEFRESLRLPVRPTSPLDVRNGIQRLTEQLFVSGGPDWAPSADTHFAMLREWMEIGITHYIPVHAEFDLGSYIEDATGISVHHIGVDDDGQDKPAEWFDEIIAKASLILADPAHKLVVTCAQGINRGPSAAFAILLWQGWEPLVALRAIRRERPIANILYAEDAVRWHVLRNGGTDAEAFAAEQQVRDWFDRNELDTGYVIDDIGSSYGR